MKLRNLLFLIMAFSAIAVNAQKYQEVVYLKNGSAIRGVVIEQTPNESLRIKTSDGSIYVYQMSDVEKIVKEETTGKSNGANKENSSESNLRPRIAKNKEANENGYLQLGIRAGLNVSNMKYKYEGYSENEGSQPHIGYHLGFIIDVPLFMNYLYIQPGLYLTSKGYKYKDNDGSSTWKETDSPTYLEIPILFSGRYTLGMAQLQLNIGPYLACGVFGKYKVEETYKGNKEKESENTFGDDGWKRFDAGFSLGAGVLLSQHYYIGFQYEFGLANILPSEYSGKDRNRNFMLSVGYNF